MTLWEEIKWTLFCFTVYLFVLAKIVCCAEGVEIEDHHTHGHDHVHDQGHSHRCDPHP